MHPMDLKQKICIKKYKFYVFEAKYCTEGSWESAEAASSLSPASHLPLTLDVALLDSHSLSQKASLG